MGDNPVLQRQKHTFHAQETFSLSPDFHYEHSAGSVSGCPVPAVLDGQCCPRRKAAPSRLSLKMAREPSAVAIRGSLSASAFARVAVLWTAEFLQNPNQDQTRLKEAVLKSKPGMQWLSG